MNSRHFISNDLITRKVRIVVAGVGGNGAQMLSCLARLDIALRELGHPEGLSVVAFDPDSVSEANIGRQIWFPSDLGEYKAVVAVERLNLAYGMNWQAIPAGYDPSQNQIDHYDILISCVDTRSARAKFHHAIKRGYGPRFYWLDLGNLESIGQVVLGQVPKKYSGTDAQLRLPMVTELFPSLLDRSKPEINTHSCSLRISLQSQGLFINDVTARYAAQLLYEFFSKGNLKHHGALINLETLRTNPISIDPVVWTRFGYQLPQTTRKVAA